MKNILIFCFVSFLAFSCKPNSDNVLLVNNAEQLQTILDSLANVSLPDTITLLLPNQTFEVEKPITITKPFSFPIKIVGNQTIISGGKQLSTRTEQQLTIADAKTVPLQVEANGKLLTVSRWPNATDSLDRIPLDSARYHSTNGKIFDSLSIYISEKIDLCPQKNLKGAVLVVYKDWAASKYPIGAYDSVMRRVVVYPPFAIDRNGSGHNTLMNNERVKHFAVFIESANFKPDAPNEWGFDDNKVFAYTQANQLNAIYNDELFKIDLNNAPTSPIIFKGITFANAGYKLPKFGHEGRQAGMYNPNGLPELYDGIVTAAIGISNAADIWFDSCTFSCLAGNGVYFGNQTKNCGVKKSKVNQIGCNGLMAGIFKKDYDSLTVTSNIQFSENDVSEVGIEFLSGIGVLMGLVNHGTITENQVYNCPYTGISMGWRWDTVPTFAGNNNISTNHVHHVMQQLGDGGGIYVLGNQPNSVMSNNLVENILRSAKNFASPNNGLYFDEGSRGWTVKGNTVRKVSHAPIRSHRATGFLIEGNKLYYQNNEIGAFFHTPNMGYEMPPIVATSDTVIRWITPSFLRHQYDSVQYCALLKNNDYIVE